ncbi:glycosyltransferase [candidate division KSB3 bacterium]|uniref:Glycosyltransferase n=1 Tax=candidate division KSB3 bacterium TaxID=2044937 RepID=A0A9D5JXL7_9BACT|nr:glycosyltransferase [candidate division KSB3 bacterium]MBD3326029.1 glycosyltransferase [candidate division KSB3 bacterium]
MTLFIINAHPQDVVGGSEIQCDLLAAGLTRAGHDVIYLAVNGRQPQYETIYPVVPCSLKWRELHSLVRRYQPALVYWRFNKRKFLTSVLMFKILHVKVVFAISHRHDVMKWSHKVLGKDAGTVTKRVRLWSARSRQLLSRRMNHLGYRLVDGVIAQLDSQAGKLPVQKQVVIPNSVDPSAVPFAWTSSFVLWVGTIKTVKNPEAYVELAQRLQDLQVDFLMVGTIHHARYKYLAQTSKLPPHFQHLGAKSYAEVNGILQQSLFLVHTCEPEGLPNIFLQAWMRGKPTISLFYDPDQIIQTHGLGYVSGDLDQCARDARALIEDAALRQEMGHRAKHYADAHFRLETNLAAFEAFVQDLCRE